jgi:type I restriction enzyme S subunit
MKTARLSELVENRKSSYGNELGEDDADAFVVKVSNVSGAGQFHGEFERRSFSKEELAQLTVRPGDLCVVKSSGSKTNVLSGKTALVTSDTNSPLVASNFCFCLRPNVSLVEPRYLWRVLNSPASKSFIATIVSAFTYPNLKWSTYSNHPIPLPPLPEQKRIAAILDAADALRAKRRESIEQLDSLIQATFLEMFGDPLTNPKGWPISTLGEVADFHAGSTLPPAHAFVGQRDGFLYLKVSDLNSVENQSVVVAAQLWHSSKQKGIGAPAKSVVIPKRGGAIGTNKKRLLGRSAVLDPNLMAISCKTDLHHSYLLRWFHTFDLVDITSGSTVPQLNKRDLAPLAICIPPLDLQTRFASIVESIEQQKARQKAHLAELDTLFASLQSRAFNGELVA